MQNYNKRDSKTKSRMTMKIGIDVKYRYSYKIMKPDFWYLFSNLNYVAKLPNWSVGGCHANRIKNPAYSNIIYPSMVNMQHFVFELRLL